MRPVIAVLVLVLAAAGVMLALNRDPDPGPIEAHPAGLAPGIYDPVRAGEETPPGFSQLLPRDAILPVYSPTFQSKEAAGWPAETLVIGVDLDGEAKAYPVSFLNRREMVIDWIGGSPVLVTW